MQSVYTVSICTSYYRIFLHLYALYSLIFFKDLTDIYNIEDFLVNISIIYLIYLFDIAYLLDIALYTCV